MEEDKQQTEVMPIESQLASNELRIGDITLCSNQETIYSLMCHAKAILEDELFAKYLQFKKVDEKIKKADYTG